MRSNTQISIMKLTSGACHLFFINLTSWKPNKYSLLSRHPFRCRQTIIHERSSPSCSEFSKHYLLPKCLYTTYSIIIKKTEQCVETDKNAGHAINASQLCTHMSPKEGLPQRMQPGKMSARLPIWFWVLEADTDHSRHRYI